MDEGSTAAPAPTGTEANQPTNTEPAKAPEPVQTTAPAAPTANIPADQIEAFNKFVESNGGYEKAFSKLKNAVSAPVQQTQQTEQIAQQPIQSQQSQQPQQMEQIPDGFLTGSEYLARKYFKDLAAEEEYKDIAPDIASGKVLVEMAEFGMEPVRNGMLNEKVIRKFLSMKARATAPAKPTSTPVNNAPTVEYVNVGDKITSMADARKILAQNQTLNGVTHPMTEQAKEFIKNYYSGNK
jgi:hypothetical protein